jgi:hypothetical protein
MKKLLMAIQLSLDNAFAFSENDAGN